MKRNQNCVILDNRAIADGIYRMVLTTDRRDQTGGTCCPAPELAEGVKAGQFLNLYTDDAGALLPRPISICRAQGDEITLIYKTAGKGTEQFSRYAAGKRVRVLLPLGNGYDLQQAAAGVDALLVGGGVGVPPMLELAAALSRRGVSVRAVLGFLREPFLLQEMAELCDEVFVATDEGTAGFHGNAVQLIEDRGLTADLYFACGPRGMLRALATHCAAAGKPLQVSLEERMGCGYGACVGCTCEIKDEKTGDIQRKRVCKDGPVFSAQEVVWNG